MRKRDPHTGRDKCPISGFEVHGFGRHQVCTGVSGVRVPGDHDITVQDRSDNGDINGIGHPMRLMQNPTTDARTSYRERLSPSLRLLVTVALAGPMVSLIFVPVGSTVALVIGAAVSAVLVTLFIALTPVVAVTGTVLRAGRAHIDTRYLGEATALTGEEARVARGTGLPARGWHLIRGGIDGVVIVANTDPDDPIESWTISTRTPDRLAAAIRAAQA